MIASSNNKQQIKFFGSEIIILCCNLPVVTLDL
jgi:hypothetical protein